MKRAIVLSLAMAALLGRQVLTRQSPFGVGILDRLKTG